MNEERLVDIESKLAHQDQLIYELNDVVTKQQEQIMQIEKLCNSLVNRMRAMSDTQTDDAGQDERPPHY
ncbi:MAG: SlyX family protein [Proteobacteria bacterium]|nr:SlyX family protein [Pseudomonadota bacterium]